MKQKKPSTLTRLLSYFRGHWSAYAVGGLYVSFSDAATDIIIAMMMKFFVDSFLTGNLSELLRNVIAFALILFLLAAFYPLAMRSSGGAVESILSELRQQLFSRLQDLPLAYHEKAHSSDTAARLSNDIALIKDGISSNLFRVVSLVLSATASTFYLGLINWKFIVLALTIVGLSLWHNRVTGPSMRHGSTAVQASLATFNERLKDMLTGISVIRAFNLEARFTDKLADANVEVRRLGSQLVRHQAVNAIGNNLFGTATFMGVLAFGGFLMLQGEISPGDAVAAVQLCNGISYPIHNLGDLWSKLQSSLGAADRAFAILDEPIEQLSANNDQAAPAKMRASGNIISLQNLHFAYENGQHALNNINLEVEAGSIIALAGPSGGGKSTIFKLLLGFYKASGGQCSLFGQPLADYNLAVLREQIAFVPQEGYLFTGTIYENIAYGRPDANNEEIIAAARAANAHDFISRMPDGYETQVGERGTQLSGGQRQRIAIARALLKDAPLLLLDEATSSLDSESEQLVQEALGRLMQGRTVLVIAHRLSTIEDTDCIHVLADGRIVESGSHQQLLQQAGLYRRLYERQLKTS